MYSTLEKRGKRIKKLQGPFSQLIERLATDQKVRGLNPLGFATEKP